MVVVPVAEHNRVDSPEVDTHGLGVMQKHIARLPCIEEQGGFSGLYQQGKTVLGVEPLFGCAVIHQHGHFG